jgi:DNA-binding Lrp family transcriptional regulator
VKLNKLVRLSGLETNPIKLDLKDKKIMSILVEDARISLVQLAKKVGLKRDTVRYRMERLIKSKLITGFAPLINFQLLGLTSYELFLLTNNKTEDQQKKFIDSLKKFPYIKGILEYTDHWDLKLTIIAKDLQDFDKLTDEIQNKFSSKIVEKNSIISIKTYSSSSISDLFYKNPKKTLQQTTQPKKIKIDEKDIRILEELSENCRQSTYEIAEKLNIGPDTVGLRIKKLTQNKIIRNFATIFDYSKISLSWYTLETKLKKFDEQTEEKIKALVKKNPKITSARKTLGNWDLLFSIVTENQKEFHQTVKEIKSLLLNEITSHQILSAYNEPYFTAFPKILSKPTSQHL